MVGDVHGWMENLVGIFTTTADNEDMAQAVYEEAKTSAARMELDVPSVPRGHRGGTQDGGKQPSTSEQIRLYYTAIFKQCMQQAASIISDRYANEGARNGSAK